MLFRRQPRVQQDIITAHFPNPKTAHLSPSNVSISSYPTPSTLEEALSLSSTPPRPPPHLSHSKTSSLTSSQPLDRSQSSGYFLEIKKTFRPSEPKSRKSQWGRTIHTDATATQPAFESDAFAVQMPTTRDPIIDKPTPAPELMFRAKVSSPSKAQVDAYQTYKQKAQQVRERNNSEGVRVPSKIISYDYAYASKTGQPAVAKIVTDSRPPGSPPQLSPAGSFPTSPPVAQHAWETSAAAQAPRKEPIFGSVGARGQGARSLSESSSISIARKPVSLSNNQAASSTPPRSRFQRVDSVTGASSLLAGSPPKIKVRLVPRVSPTQTQARTHAQSEPLQKESSWSLYTKPSHSSSAESSCSSSPSKPNPRFVYTTSASENVSAANNTIFGYTSTSIKGTPAAPQPQPHPHPKPKPKDPNPKRTLTSRLAWLRPPGPRIAKPTPTSLSPAPPPAAPSRPVSIYIDPFAQHATTPLPAASSPRKLTLARPIPDPSPKRTFETGFAQITRVATLLLKVCVILYVLIAVYFVLDAVREAVHALGAPFRGARVAWGGVVWMGGCAARGWERWVW